MIDVTDDVLADIRKHAAEEYPTESCGLIAIVKGKQVYFPCKNIAKGRDFAISAEDYSTVEDIGEIVMVVHSHPDIPPKPSQADLIECEKSGLPWLIVNWPTGITHQFSPSGYVAPLIGRPYVWRITDCYSLIRDYYKQQLNISLKDYDRDFNFWHNGQNLYLDYYEAEGFSRVKDIQKHDVVLMQVRSPVPNHGAVYIGDGLIMHHMNNRLSSRDTYGGIYQKVTTHILRHRDLM